jgi:hypothetical protein
MAVGFPTKVSYANGDVFSASDINDTNGTVNLLTSTTLSLQAGKNAIINGGMDIWQRGTSVVGSGSAYNYTADRWRTEASTSITVSRQATGDTTNLPNIQYCARAQRNNGSTATALVMMAYSQETTNTIPYAGKAITFSFYARRGSNFSGASNQISALLITGTGTDQNVFVGGYTGASNLIAQTPTLTTTWQRFTYTATMPSTATEFGVEFYYTPTGTAGANDYYEVTGVQVELGSVATTFSRAGGTIQGELAACQRYYYRLDTDQLYSNFAWGFAYATTAYKGTVALPVTLRVPPSAIDYSTLKLHNVNTAVTAGLTASITASEQNKYLPTVTVTVSSGLTTGGFYYLGANNSTSGYIGFSAEL